MAFSHKTLSILLLVELLFGAHAQAEPLPVIETGRPGQSIGTEVVGQHVLQIQSGIEANSSKVNNIKNDNLINNTVIRYGISDQIELSTLFDLNDISAGPDFENFRLGGRLNIIEQSHVFIPSLAVQSRVKIVDDEGQVNSRFEVNTTLSALYDFGAIGSLVTNLTISNLDRDRLEFTDYTMSWSRSFNESISYFVELYGNKTRSSWQQSWNTGLGYLANRNLLLDLSFGTDLQSDVSNKFVSVGFSWRKL